MKEIIKTIEYVYLNKLTKYQRGFIEVSLKILLVNKKLS